MEKKDKQKAEWIYIAASVICALFPYIYPLNSVPYLGLGLSLLAELGLYAYFNKKFYGSIFNFAFLFVALLFVFNFGQVLLLAFMQKQVAPLRIVLRYFSERDCLRALRFMNFAFLAIAIGTLRNKDTGHQDNPLGARLETGLAEKGNHLYEANKWAWIIIVLTLPVKVMVDANFLFRSFREGFFVASDWLQAYPNFIRAYGNIAFIGVTLLVVSLQEKPRKQLIACGLSAAYLVVLMLGGWRAENVCYLLVIALLYIKTREKDLRLGKLLLCAAAAYVFLAFLNTVVTMRAAENRGVWEYCKAFFTVTFGANNALVEALREYGNTGYTAICVIQLWLENFLPSFGKSYLFGATAILPNLTGLPGKLTEQAAFALDLQKYGMLNSKYTNIGGSIIGEAFFNFDILGGITFCYLIGLFIGWISARSHRSMQTGKILNLVYYIPLMFGCLFWIRDAFGGVVRDMVWGAAFCWILLHLKEYWAFIRKRLQRRK